MAIINGTSASEIIKGTQVADTISGLGGDDRLVGYSGKRHSQRRRRRRYSGRRWRQRHADRRRWRGRVRIYRIARFKRRERRPDHGLQRQRGRHGQYTRLCHVPALVQPQLHRAVRRSSSMIRGRTRPLSPFMKGSTTPVFQLKFTGHVEYDQSAFVGIAPNPFGEPTEGHDQLSARRTPTPSTCLVATTFMLAVREDDFVAGGSGNDFIGRRRER